MELTKEYIKENLFNKTGGLNSCKTRNLEVSEQLNRYNAKSISELCYLILNDMVEPPKCLNSDCNNKVNFNRTSRRYNGCCSLKCSANSKEIKEKIKNTCLKKYGTETPSQSKEIKDKTKATNMKRYGAEHPSQLSCVKEKKKKNNLEKYGVENPSQLSCVKEKKKVAYLKRYGVEHLSQSNVIKDKIKATNMKRYGATSPLHSKEIKEKIKKINIERYGAEIPSQSKEIKDKIKQYNITIAKVYIVSLLENKGLTYVEPQEYKGVTYKDEDGVRRTHRYKAMCNGCNRETEVHYPQYRCLHCEPKKSLSKPEKDLLEFIKENYKGQIIENDRSILKGKELDIYIPELSLAFEFNGTYWHSYPNKERNYHQNKTDKALEAGISLIHIWQHDWEQKTEIVKSMILNKLGMTKNRIYARNTEFKNIINKKEAYIFLENNHLHGYGKPTRHVVGLYQKDKLLSVMTISKDGNIVRQASLINHQIIGGFGKLFKHTKHLIKYTFADIDWSPDANKTVYTKYMNNTNRRPKPHLCYYNQNLGIVESREKYMKHKLRGLFGNNIDLHLTENEICIENNVLPIYRCGNYKFEVQ